MSYIQRVSMNGKREVPRIRVSFHTEKQCYQVIPTSSGLDPTPDPTSQLISVSTTKMLQSPAGAFNIELAGDQWLSRLKPNDLVVIAMGYKTDEKLPTVMVGLIDSVGRRRAVRENQATVNTVVTGRDMGKILLKSTLKFYPELHQADIEKLGLDRSFFLTEVGWKSLLEFFTGDQMITGSPANVLDIIVRRILQKLYNVKWQVYDESGREPVKREVGIGNILRYNFAKTDFFTLPTMLSLTSFEGSLWNLMERACHKPFLELFVDTRDHDEAWNSRGVERVVNEPIEESSSEEKAKLQVDAYPSPGVSFGEDKAKVLLALRNTPFDKELWKKLKSHEISDEDVIDENNIGFSDNEHYNLFWAGTTINPLLDDMKRVSPPEINGDNIQRYGLSPLEVQIEGLQFDPNDMDNGARNLLLLTDNLNKKLKNWFENNHTFWSGTLEVKGKGSYRVGQRLVWKGANREFYIEGVSHNYTLFSGWTTTLTLTRGQPITAEKNTENKAPVTILSSKPTSSMTIQEVNERFHKVVSGDTLWALANKYYGNSELWYKIWEANADILIQRDSRNKTDKGRWIYPGQQLRIP